MARTVKTPRATRAQQAAAITPAWTLKVEGFGKIRRASISMAPLVMLVGKNNTGKSHIASLLWALLNAEQTLLSYSRRSRDAPSWLIEILRRPTAENEIVEGEFTPEITRLIEIEINSILKSNKDALVRDVLSFPSASVKKLEISLEVPRHKILSTFLSSAAAGERGLFSWDNRKGLLHLGITEGAVGPHSLASLFYDFLIDGVLSGGASAGVAERAVYIPAARTGLMLAFKTIVSRLLDGLRLRHGAEARGEFSLPIISFMQELAEVGRRSSSAYEKIAEALERDILKGSVKVTEGASPEFTYQPVSSKTALPMHVSSSMVTELAPFLVLLRSGDLSAGVIFEEPEAHLHIAAQRSMAKGIVRMVNAGIPVVITTHSDTFLQQINLSMELFSHKKRSALAKAFGYNSDEMLDPEKARAYEFVDDGDGTAVVELSKPRIGFAVPSLNSTLEDLADELITIEQGA